MSLRPGDPVEFELLDQDGNVVRASQFRGSPVILFFYPRADTPGCTAEVCEFRDADTQLKQAGAIVLGISRDGVKAQKKFASKYHLPFPLLADPQLTVCTQFDVVHQGTMYGKAVTRIERSTFLLDREGQLEAEFRKVKPEGHALHMVTHLLGRA